MDIECKVVKIMPATSGESARGPWQRQEVVFEQTQEQFARKICVTFFNKPEDVQKLVEGGEYTVGVNIEAREYNGRWYNDVRAWRVQPKQGAAAPAAAAMPAAAPMPTAESQYSAPAAPAEVDDLPF